MTEPTDIKTLGTTTFGRCGQGSHRLFRITHDIPAIQALEHASNLQDCANRLAVQLAMGEGCAQTAWSSFRQVVTVQGLPFEVRVPSEKTARAMAQAREIRRQFDSIDDMLKDADDETGEEAKTR